jgi:formylglycine-generating enzyme required for sulfatase activity
MEVLGSAWMVPGGLALQMANRRQMMKAMTVLVAVLALAGGCVAVATGKELVLTIPGGRQAKLRMKLRMKLIPAGRFTMGSTANEKGRKSNEGPVPEVVISKSFYMGVYEVTQAQWQAVMGNNPSSFGGKPQNPVEQVLWEDCQKFLEKLNGMGIGTFRLPTEAEWEYACRAGTKTAYSFGDDVSKLKEYANYEDTPKYGLKSTAPVGSFKPNSWGLYDMYGNVWEWCSDWYGDYGTGRQTDPKGAARGSLRVLRGGCWSYSSRHCRSAYRSWCSPLGRHSILGFRVVREVR